MEIDENAPPPQDMKSASSTHPKPVGEEHARGRIGSFLAALAGYDLGLVSRYATQDAEHERRKLVLAGASVMVPTVLALFTGYFFLAPYAPNVSQRVLGAVVIALVVFAVDCIIVTTLAKESLFGILVRVAISVAMGFVIAEPLLNHLFHETLNEHIAARLQTERADRERKYSDDARKLNDEATRLRSEVAGFQAVLDDYAPSNTATRHFKESSTRKEELLSGIRNRKTQDSERLNEQKRDLDKQRTELQGAIEKKLVEMQQELEGKRESRQPGVGSVYRHLQEELRVFEKEQQRISENILSLNRSLDAIANDRSAEARVEAEIVTDSSISGASALATLTPEETRRKRQLESDIAGHAAALAGIEARQEQIRQETSGLPREFALSAHDDSLALTRALYEILAENWFLRIKAGAIFALLFLIDITPVLTKLTLKTGYDQYVKLLSGRRLAQGADSRDEIHASLVRFTRSRIDRWWDLRVGLTDKPGLLQPADSSHSSVVNLKIDREIERLLDELILEARNMQPEHKQPNVFRPLFSGIRHARELIKNKRMRAA